MNTYNSLNIIITTLSLYIISYLLVSAGSLKLINHRKIWNMALLVTFIVMGTLGTILAITLDLGINLTAYIQILWYHVEFGIVMAVISVFHTLWHWKYFSKLIHRKQQ